MRRNLLVISLIFAISTFITAQEVKKVPAKYTSPASGTEMYKAYCGACHGEDLKGKGPAASAMKSGVPDLTVLAKKNAGKFPMDHVSQIISGDTLVPAHGSKDMPVWGPVFMSIDQHSQSMVLMRASNLAHYIESKQAK